MSVNLFLEIFQNLNITSYEFKFILGTHLVLQQGIVKNLWVFFQGRCRHLLFFHSLPEMKAFCTFYSINFASHLQKEIPMAALSDKKKSIAKTVALNYISPKVYRITHHAQILTATATTKATWENRKVRNIITQYRAMSIWLGAFANISWNQWTSVK